MAWSADGLFVACMTKRGCLLLLPRFGPPLRLVTHGCSLDMGPLTHLPLHPLITVTYVGGVGGGNFIDLWYPSHTHHSTHSSLSRRWGGRETFMDQWYPSRTSPSTHSSLSHRLGGLHSGLEV